tara:strand:- start:539 stop:796 length:258 start_codon:yes stop_codon:yes gene_type:complete
MSEQLIFNALVADCNNDIAAARAELSIYIRSSVGIGEHPQHLAEAKKILQKLTDGKDRLKTLQEEFQMTPAAPVSNPEGKNESKK